MTTKINELADEYFSVLNPIAMKIKFDINETKLCYEHIWDKLNINEQIDIINETIIKPEIALRYFDLIEKNVEKIETNYLYDNQNLSTFNKIKTGQKIILDDVTGDYRDVHSSPFSFKTKSQMNLNIFHNLLQPSATIKTSKTIIETNKMKLKTSTVPIDTSQPPTAVSVAKKNSETIKYSKIIETTKPPAIENPSQNFIAKFIGNLNTKRYVRNDEDEQNLVSNISVGLNSSSTIPSDEEDITGTEIIDVGKNLEEFKRLLEGNDVKEGYDFLNNW